VIVLALLEIPEDAAADAICQAASHQVAVRQRLRYATQWIVATQPAAVQVRWVTLARQDRQEQARQLRPGGA
jgi:hypothetical protein